MEYYRTVITLVHRDPAIPGKCFESTIEISSLSKDIKLTTDQLQDAINKLYAAALEYKLRTPTMDTILSIPENQELLRGAL